MTKPSPRALGEVEERARQREIVRKGYDEVSYAYRDDAGRPNEATAEETQRYGGWVDEMARLLPPAARVLDLGCGAGIPATRQLVDRGLKVTGLDFSAVQIGRARRLVPGAAFIQADMTTWDCDPASFDAVVSFYALIHVPLGDQQALFPRIRRWLREGGLFLAILGDGRWTGTEQYLGAPMFWDHADTATYLDWLREAGFVPIWHRFVPEGDSGHQLVLAKAT